MAEATGRYGSLRFQSAEGRERLRLLEQPSSMLGRGSANDIVLDDPSVATRHARLSIEGGRLIVEDLGSGTGTFVDGHPIPPGVPTLVSDDQELRFGNVATRFGAPEAEGAAAAGGVAATGLRGSRDEAPPEVSATIRLTMNPPAQPLVAGGGPVIAHVQVTNAGRVVDQLTLNVLDLPQDWVRVNTPEFVLVPGESTEVSIAIQVPRRSDALAGVYDFSVVVGSAETGREVFASGTVELKPYYETLATLRPRRAKKRFEVQVENRGNNVVTFGVAGRDEDDVLQFDFSAPSITVEPGQTARLPFDALSKRRLFGKQETHAFNLKLTSTADSSVTAETSGQVVNQPPLQRLLVPSLLAIAVLAAVLGALLFLLWPFGDDDASAVDLLSLVHPMCDPDAEPEEGGAQAGQTVRTGSGDSGEDDDTGGSAQPPALTTLYAQNDDDWAPEEYAKAKDPDFGPDWCGDTIAQCGCAMTSMANVMSVLALATMPDGQQLTPETLNAWLNLQAVRDSRGWVSQGYAYGNVLWMAANQLSGEMNAEFGTPTIRFNGWGAGDDAFIRSQLEAGRPVVLEIPGHFIAAYGIDEATNEILTYDPYYPDRTTINYYHNRGIPIRGTRLFELSDDLSGVMITTPRDVRIKVTLKATGEEVGTLNTAPADEAATRVRREVPGADYLTTPAWRDPTCTEKAPPPEAGVNQIWLPGSIDDYVIEYLNTTDDVPAVAIHSYNRNGEVTILQLEGPATGQIQTFGQEVDEDDTDDGGEDDDDSDDGDTDDPGDDDDSDDPGTDTGGGTTGGGTTGGGTTGGTPPGGTTDPGTTTPPGGDPPEEEDVAGEITPGTPPGPDTVAINCNATYQATPKLATVDCMGQVGGTFDSLQWNVNGVPAAANVLVLSATFDQNTAITVDLRACAGTDCESGSRAVVVEFPAPTQPPGNGGTTTNGTLSATPQCSVSYVTDSHAMIACMVTIDGTFTSVAWSAPGTSNPSQPTGSQTYETNQTNNGQLDIPVNVTVKVCNGTDCVTASVHLNVRPRYSTTTTFTVPFFDSLNNGYRIERWNGEGWSDDLCVAPGALYRVQAIVLVSPPAPQLSAIEGFVQFHLAAGSTVASPFGSPVPATFRTNGYVWEIEFFNGNTPLAISAEFLGTTNLARSFAPPISIPRCGIVLNEPENGDEFTWPASILMDWDGVPDAEAYQIEIRRVSPTPATVVDQTVSGSAFVFNPATPGVFEWRVRQTEPGLSDWSETRTFTVLAAPMVIVEFEATFTDCPLGFDEECVELSWIVTGDPFGSILIERFIGPPPGVTFLETSELSGDEIDEGRDSDQCFSYLLTATNSDGDSVSESSGLIGLCLT